MAKTYPTQGVGDVPQIGLETVEERAGRELAEFTTPPPRRIFRQREPETLEEWAATFENDPGPLERWAATLPEYSLTAERRKELDEDAKILASDPTGIAGVGDLAIATETRPWEYPYFEQKFSEEVKKTRSAAKLSTGEAITSSGLLGTGNLGQWAFNRLGALQLDDEQELFRQRLQAIREGLDPLAGKDAPWWKRGMVGAAEQYPMMVTSVATGGAAGAGAGALGLGSLGIRVASGAGVGAVYYKQMRDDTYYSLLREDVPPEVAGPAAAISGILQGAAEGLPVSNPFASGVLNKTLRGVATRLIGRFGVETAGEEFAQALIDGTVQELTKRSVGKGDKEAHEVFIDAAKETWEGMPAATFLMGPGMVLGGAAESAVVLQQSKRRKALLQQIRGKGWVSEKEGQQEGIVGANRTERMENLKAEEQSLDEEIQDAVQEREAEALHARQAPGDRKAVGPEVREVEVGAEQTGQVPPTPEVPVENLWNSVQEATDKESYLNAVRAFGEQVPEGTIIENESGDIQWRVRRGTSKHGTEFIVFEEVGEPGQRGLGFNTFSFEKKRGKGWKVLGKSMEAAFDPTSRVKPAEVTPTPEVQVEEVAPAVSKARGVLQSLVEKYPDLTARYEADAGVSEGYTVGEHTERALARWADQDIDAPPETKRLLRLVVALHDIGKGEAVAQGQKGRQHEFTLPVLREILAAEGFSEGNIALAEAMVDQDIIGQMLQGKMSPMTAASKVRGQAKRAGIDPKNFLKAATAFYRSDAGAYPRVERAVMPEGTITDVRLGVLEEAIHGEALESPWIGGIRAAVGETRGEGRGRGAGLIHATAYEIQEFDPDKDSGKNRVGPGVYLLTQEDADVAQHYADRALRRVLNLFSPAARRRIRQTNTPEEFDNLIRLAQQKRAADTKNAERWDDAITVLRGLRDGVVGKHILNVEVDIPADSILDLGSPETGGRVLTQEERNRIADAVGMDASTLPKRGMAFYNAIAKEKGKAELNRALESLGYRAVSFLHAKNGFHRRYPVLNVLNPADAKITRGKPEAPQRPPGVTPAEEAPTPPPVPKAPPVAAREPGVAPLAPDADWDTVKAEAKAAGIKIKGSKENLIGQINAKRAETAPPRRRAGPGGTVPVSPLPRGGKAPSTGEVVSALSAAFGVPIRTGHFRGGPQRRGIYKELEKVARIKGYGDIAASAHEVAHHVDNTTDVLANLPAPLQAELSALDYDTDRGDIHEGFAEYVRHRLTTGEAATHAPRFDGWFSDWLKANPAVADAFQAATATVDQWRGAGAVERVKAQINRGESVWRRIGRALRPKTLWEWIQNNWVDRLRPLRETAKEMTATGSDAALLDEMPADLNFWAFAKATTISAAAKARGWAHYGTADAAGNKVGPGLKETLGPIANELRNRETLQDFYAYTYARHALTLHEQHDAALKEWRDGGEVGPPPQLKDPGISRMDATATIAEFDNKPGWQEAAQGLTSWHNDLIDYLVDAGGLSAEAAEAMKAMYPNYISLARHMDSEFATAAGTGGGRFADLPKGVFRLKGSGRQILPPLESALAYAERIIGLADKVRVSRMLVEASERYGTLGDTVEKVDPKDIPQSTRLRTLKSQLEDAGADLSGADMDALLTVFSQDFTGDAKDNVLVLYEDGKPQLYYVRPDLYRALMAVDKPARLPAIIDQTFGRIARAIRLGTTGLKPGFSLLTNPLRDIGTALGQTEYQPRNPFSIALNSAQGIVEEIAGTEVAQLWERGGGPMAQPLGIDRRFLKETVGELTSQSPKAKVLNWARHPVDSLRSLFSLPEGGPRLAEFRAALRESGWAPGKKVTFEQYVNAQIAAANVTVDFREAGWLGQWVNQMIPFFNAQIQGPNRMSSAIRNHPTATIGSAVLWLTLPTLLLWWRQKDEEWYKSLNPMERYRYWHVRIPGTDTILRIPKPFEWGHIFSSMPEAAAQSAYDEDPEALKEAAGTMLEDVNPFTMVGPVPVPMPGIAEAPIEIAANKDFFFDRPLVSERLKADEPVDQYTPYTTEAAKAIGRILGVSPIYVEHLASGWTGGLATQAIGAVESMAGLRGKKTQRAITGGPSTLPVVGRLFLSPLHTRQFDDFYNRLEKLEQKHSSLKKRGKSDPSITMLKFMQDRSADLAELRNESRAVLADESLTDDQKRDRFLNIHLQMVQMATEANEIANRHRPSTSADAKKKWAAIHKEESRDVIYNAAKPPPDPDDYKDRKGDLRKAQKKYRESRELEKHRASAVVDSYEEAQKTLIEYFWSQDRDETTEANRKRAEALDELYGKPEGQYKKWRAAEGYSGFTKEGTRKRTKKRAQWQQTDSE